VIGLRSLVFNVYFFALTAFGLFTYWVLLPFPRTVLQEAVRLWQRLVFAGLKGICGLTWEARGRERIPAGAAVFACKHQSAWDTMAFYALVADPAYVLKKELMRIPFWGWYATKTRQVVVDRRAGLRALKEVAAAARERLAEGRQVVIFPQGTRVAPGAHRPYQPGVFAIYDATDTPVFPVALNSGLFWGRRSFLKQPGTVTLEILEPMPKGMDRKPFTAELERRIEEASERLAAEARERFPGLRNRAT
jgi:1-acyl-sn-glycerol-3-phosphate acyltransferase